MTPQPSLDPRRASDFARELLARARTWLPHWKLAPGTQDPGRALLEVAARLNAEVAERLDQVAEKNRRNLARWLGIRGAAARGARVPVAFTLTDSARRNVLARAPVQMQADAGSVALVFESEEDVLLVPARVVQLVAVDPAIDAYYLPPPGLTSLDALAPVPTQWRVRGFAAAGSDRLQLEPSLGLAVGMILAIGGRQYRVTKLDDDIVTVDPAIDDPDGIAQDAIASKVAAFEPFEGAARNRQNHALYLGHADLLNIEAAATIEVVNGDALASFRWEYWGKLGDSDAAWNELDVPLDQSQRNTLVLDKATAGAIEPREIAGVKSRWIRAVVASLEGRHSPLPLADLQLRIGSASNGAQPKCEGLVNTTPLVLDREFLPLGREPRQFDAFYLGCSEAFSKKGAKVKLELLLADRSLRSLVVLVAGLGTTLLLAGTARDRKLHLFNFDTSSGAVADLFGPSSLQPFDPASPDDPIPLDAAPPWRLPSWSLPGSFGVAVSSGAAVWTYGQSTLSHGLWTAHGTVVASPSNDDSIEGLVCLSDGGALRLYALYGGRLLRKSIASSGPWSEVPTTESGTSVQLRALAPVDPGPVAPMGSLRLVGVSQQGALHAVEESGNCELLVSSIEILRDVQPIAAELQSGTVIVFAAARDVGGRIRLVAHDTDANRTDTIELAEDEEVAGLAFDLNPEDRTVIATVKTDTDSRLVWWTAFGGGTGVLLEAPLQPTEGRLAGLPTRVGQFAIVPGSRGDVLVLPLRTVSGRAPLQRWAKQAGSASALAVGDLVNDSEQFGGLAAVTDAPIDVGAARYYPLTAATLDPSYPPDPLQFRVTDAPVTATLGASSSTESELLLDVVDALDGVDIVAIQDGGSYQLFSVDPPGSGPGTTIRPGLSAAAGPTIHAWPADAFQGRVVSVLRLDQATTPPATAFAASDFDTASIAFPGAVPRRQSGTVVLQTPAGDARAVALSSQWLTEPPVGAFGEVDYSVVGAPGAWLRHADDAALTPQLSWEYSDGRSWRRLPGVTDGTRNLRFSDKVEFTVPEDLAESDWSGRMNHWIRARLTGGDYGKEEFTVETQTVSGVTKQTMVRSITGIRPPVVDSIRISYSFDVAQHPDAVLAEDAGGFRDQSDANRTAGAEVEAFVPLAVTIARLDGRIDTQQPAEAAGGADRCGCAAGGGCSSRAASLAARAANGTPPGRSLLVGIAGKAQGEPINLLFAVGAEHAHEAAAPLRVEALVAGRFQPLVAVDGTRALGESGLVTMTLPEPPTTTALFGQQLAWLRLTPARDTEWRPSVATAVLNAAWASAAETQTLEVLGSSGGEPDLTLTVARPPLLRDSLELRIREALTDEEVDELNRSDAMRVRSDVPGLPGHWVRWEPVVDPTDSAASERVYALDEATGTVRFGDGRHGMVPPIGRDHIVAFRYRRVEPLADTEDASAVVTARAALGLVTPLEGVEAAVAAADAGRGAPPDDVERVLRFAPAQLRHRERALTARDVEDIVLQAQPAVAQARCLPQGTPVRLIVTMRGPNPGPSRAMVRELSDVLARVLPPTLTGALAPKLEGPALRPFRIRATLRVASLDTAGRVAQRAREALTAYFDPAHGGDDGRGWPLGRAPAVDDVAARLIDLAELDGIDALALFDLRSGGERPWTRALLPNELARLADDGIAFSYALVEVAS